MIAGKAVQRGGASDGDISVVADCATLAVSECYSRGSTTVDYLVTGLPSPTLLLYCLLGTSSIKLAFEHPHSSNTNLLLLTYNFFSFPNID
ncbi:hypothetical protein VNO80_15614 [Phaseolus coccineus]|uniref:Uncharacterized protein n=1 Tax=Phaseolus coccineus TaxID=3886 RepID=A0AAN9R342_PHACN